MLRIACWIVVRHPVVVVAGSGGAPSLDVEEVEHARLLLRSSDPVARRDGLLMVDGWIGRAPEVDAARSMLRATTAAYPSVGPDRVDPALRFGRVLCGVPRSVDVASVEAAYMVSAERVRRLLLHLLALRRDISGVSSLAFLLGPDGPTGLLPLPAGEMLSPVLDVVSAAELTPALVHVAETPGWTWHAVELLEHLVDDDRLDIGARTWILERLGVFVDQLVSACDAAGLAGASDGDRTRAERARLRSFVSLFRALGPRDGAGVLMRVLAAADPRVSAMGAAALVVLDHRVPPERLDLIARDPEARAELIDALLVGGASEQLPSRWRDGRASAEAYLVRWLACPTELGRAPDEIEHVEELPLGEHPDDGSMHVFRFRLRSPHWSSARGWMIGAAGPYRSDGSRVDDVEPFESSLYDAEDEDDLDGHVDSILDALGVWSDDDD